MIRDNLIKLQDDALSALEEILTFGSNKEKLEAVKIVLTYTLDKPTSKTEIISKSEAHEHLNALMSRNVILQKNGSK